jgi:hypothetical protein
MEAVVVVLSGVYPACTSCPKNRDFSITIPSIDIRNFVDTGKTGMQIV